MNISNGAPLRARRLDAFEEQRTLGDDGDDDDMWRRLTSITNAPVNCLDCGGCHAPAGEFEAIICPRLPVAEARARGLGRVKQKLALATGQRDSGVIQRILDDISGEIVRWAEYHPAWGQAVLQEYRGNPLLKGIITAIQDETVFRFRIVVCFSVSTIKSEVDRVDLRITVRPFG
jgi:hypothetical protein